MLISREGSNIDTAVLLSSVGPGSGGGQAMAHDSYDHSDDLRKFSQVGKNAPELADVTRPRPHHGTPVPSSPTATQTLARRRDPLALPAAQVRLLETDRSIPPLDEALEERGLAPLEAGGHTLRAPRG